MVALMRQLLTFRLAWHNHRSNPCILATSKPNSVLHNCLCQIALWILLLRSYHPCQYIQPFVLTAKVHTRRNQDIHFFPWIGM